MGVSESIEQLWKAKVMEVWNKFVETNVLPVAKQKAPRSAPNRESRVIGETTRLFSQRLADTIYVVSTPTGNTIRTDDPRAKWIEEGVRPHAINAHVDMQGIRYETKGRNQAGLPGSLMWRWPGGRLQTGVYGVLHPGLEPEPFLGPAMWEACQEFPAFLDTEVKSDAGFMSELERLVTQLFE